MNLAGEYAKACHDIAHARIQKELKASVVRVFENFHNFAWREKVDGREMIVHRKGATPAGEGVVGIIPGSMTTKTYIVSGKGDPRSISSSSHGAGRLMSRTAAKEKFTMSAMKKNLEDAGVTLVGGSLDECSMAYKNIDAVMEAQKDLVDVIGTFQPVVVRMSGEQSKPWEKE
jgi:tRNA-splicing ligase RtcB